MMTRKLILVVFSVFLTFELFACAHNTVPVPAGTPPVIARDGDGDGDSKLAKDILYYTNEFRATKGLPPLKLESYCSTLAEKHSENMASGKVPFGHDDFEIRNDAVTLKFHGVRAVAENVAYGTLDAKGVVDGWIKSPAHRKNMLGDYELIGIGTATKGRITYFTQFFVKK